MHFALVVRTILGTLLLATTIAGCSHEPQDQYKDAKFTVGQTMADVKKRFGEPDRYDQFWNKTPTVNQVFPGSEEFATAENKYHVEQLSYGPYTVVNDKGVRVPAYRLNLRFIDGTLREWNNTAP